MDRGKNLLNFNMQCRLHIDFIYLEPEHLAAKLIIFPDNNKFSGKNIKLKTVYFH